MAQCENSNLIEWHDEAVERDVAGLSVGNDQLADLPLHTPPDERVCREVVDCRADGADCGNRGAGIRFPEDAEDALDVLQRPSGIDYRWHGFGFGFGLATAPTWASRCIQA